MGGFGINGPKNLILALFLGKQALFVSFFSKKGLF
jgi:hypothetical protein